MKTIHNYNEYCYLRYKDNTLYYGIVIAMTVIVISFDMCLSELYFSLHYNSEDNTALSIHYTTEL